jgi:hypothetical protein
VTTQWEYTVLKLPVDWGIFSGPDFDQAKLNIELNALGAKGWELVSMFDLNRSHGASEFVMVVMKRPKP